MPKSPQEKAEYDKLRRVRLADSIRAYDRARNKLRRADPEYQIRHRQLKSQWRIKNRSVHLVKSRIYENNKRQVDIEFRIKKNLRRRIARALMGRVRRTSAVRNLGINISDFRVWIESKFQPGMTWENYGTWHIDHIKALSKFDLSDPEQQNQACHFKNLQPLWAADNLKKGAA